MKFDGFSFAGRINRAKYWRIKVGLFFANFFFHIWVATQFSHTALHRAPTKTGEWILLGGVILVTLVTLVVSITTDVKRYHDRDKSGWWVFIVFLPVIGAVWLLIECGFLPGTVGPNRFGPDPLSGRVV
ncbi:MAG: DUF805 domain-containing protein [Reyranella sp.]|uniref:DUF805 domain-containing protein n=1 Tax=Reyranella sp. TaxID=1929291 RepID=UPI001228CC09|nr:DUF805 domain-containing protein [Reyranella sp.]TAJ96104.1 MAG: DUF805 domain-containing protein [Reyranella sp.]TBR28847.1 MAG: DUF805 domain-containing protein [Reyranella sp.]